MKDVIRILIGPLVWLAAFTAVYGLHGMLCGHDLSGDAGGLLLKRFALIAAFAGAVVLQGALLATLYHPRFASTSGFVQFVSRATGWVGVVATFWSLFPVMVTTYCL